MEKRFLFKRLIALVFCLGVTYLGFTQGVWDIGYVPVDSVNNIWVGKEIRIDFKSSQYDTIIGNVSLLKTRKLISKRDTITLEIEEKKISLIEDWKFYVDHGTINDQTLRELTGKQLINEIYIVSVNDSALVVRMNFYKFENCKSSQIILSDNKIVAIPKKVIKGVLYRRND